MVARKFCSGKSKGQIESWAIDCHILDKIARMQSGESVAAGYGELASIRNERPLGRRQKRRLEAKGVHSGMQQHEENGQNEVQRLDKRIPIFFFSEWSGQPTSKY